MDRTTNHVADRRPADRRADWVLRHAADGYLWLDEALAVLDANRSASAWLDQGEGAVVGRAWPEVASGAFRVQPTVDWAELAGTREPHVLTLVRPEDEGGAALWLQCTMSPLPASADDVATWLVHLRDVTALQSSMGQAMSLLGLMSHKLRTPLAMVRAPVELLTEGYMSTDDPDWPAFRDTLVEALGRLQRDTDQILRLADLLEGPLLPHGEEPPDGAAIQRMLHKVAAELGVPASRIDVEVASARPPRISTEALRLVLVQLVGNAVKFHPRREPRLKVLLVDGERGGVRLCVADDGPGIPPELRERVWQPMYQIDRLGSGEVPGAGVGLTLVANLCWSLGGRAWIEDPPPASGLEGGTCVCLSLPAA